MSRIAASAMVLLALAGCAREPLRPAPPAAPVPAPASGGAVEPRDEPRARSGNPPFYEVGGRRYVVLPTAAGYVEQGIASWYGPDFHGGRTATGLDAVEWARRVAQLGAGEILLTSMDRDGTRQGFDLELTRAVADAVSIPVIASGGVGTLQHLAEGVTCGGADAVLAASIFHYGEYTVREAKEYMAQRGIPMRLESAA